MRHDLKYPIDLDRSYNKDTICECLRRAYRGVNAIDGADVADILWQIEMAYDHAKRMHFALEEYKAKNETQTDLPSVIGGAGS